MTLQKGDMLGIKISKQFSQQEQKKRTFRRKRSCFTFL